MLELGRGADRNVVALLTDMDQPLGWAIGNAIEIEEARTSSRAAMPRPISSRSPSRRRDAALALRSRHRRRGRAKRAEAAIDDGSALEAYERWISAQGGDPSLDVLPKAPVTKELTADRTGFVGEVSALGLGRVALDPRRRPPHEGGRHRPRSRASAASPSAGDEVETGQVLAAVYVAGRRRRRAGPGRDPWPDRDRRRAPAAAADRPRDAGLDAPVRRYAPAMPELPEVETIRVGLEPHLVGRTFEDGRDRRPAADPALSIRGRSPPSSQGSGSSRSSVAESIWLFGSNRVGFS